MNTTDPELWNAYAEGRRDEAADYRMTRAQQFRALLLYSLTAWSPTLLGLGVWWLFS